MKAALVSIFLVLQISGFNQTRPVNQGKYPTKLITPSEYRAGNDVLCFVQDKNGILYSGNSRGVSIYNGATWDLIELPNKSEVLWLSIDKEDKIFVAANDEFGYLKREKGVSQYQSLTHLLPDSIQSFGSSWEVESTSYGTYFRTSTYVFWYHQNELEYISMNDYPGGTYDVIFSVNDTLHLRKRQLGLGRMINKKFELLPEGKFFADVKTNAILALDNEVLIATRTEGLFIINDDGVSPFENDIQEILKEARIYHASAHNGFIAIATLTKGVFILDKNGMLIEHINEQEYSINETTNYVYWDTQDALWIATLNGIMRVDFQDRFRVYDGIKGSNIVVLDFLKYKGTFYFATSTGVYYSQTNDFKNAKKVKGINNPCYGIYIINDRIFVDVNAGVFRITENFEGIKQGESLRGFVKKTHVENCYFIGGQEGLTLATYNEKKFKIKKILEVGKNIESMFEFERNKLWLFPKNNGITYYDIDTDSMAHFPSFGNSSAIEIEGKPVFITDKGVYQYQEGAFHPSDFFYQFVDSSSFEITEISTDNDENIMVLYSDEALNIYGQWLKKSPDNYESYPVPDIDLSISDFTSTYLEGNGIFWFAGNKEIIRMDILNNPFESTPFNTIISDVYSKGKRLPKNQASYKIPFSSNTLRFEYAAIYFNSYGSNEYQYFMEGWDTEWSDWSEINSKEYAYLREGDYVFKVRSKNPNEMISNPTSFSFTITPPWYRSLVAFVIYGLIVICVIIIISRIRSARLKKENLQLEKLVDERTKEVESKNKKLQELNQLKSKFFANISHELRTPLTLINGQLEAIQREKRTSNISKQVDSSLRNASQLGSMIEDLLDLSKLELGQNMIDPKPTQINKTVKRITESFQSLSDSKNVTLEYTDETSEPIFINLDIRQFEKVINNLIYNALKFTSENGKVGLAIKSNNQSVLIEVYDTGEGIETDEIPYIFDRFYQAKNQVAKESGSGLGLAISKEIVELHQGKIEVKSKLNTGTTFIIELPKLDGDFEEEIEETEDDNLSLEQFLEQHLLKGNLDKPSVLIVEDNEEMQDYLKSILTSQFNIAQSGNGHDALEWLQQNKVDLIISDVMMPVMTGFELLEKLKASLSYQHIPVILLTARSSQEDRMEGLRFGVDDYITKPFDRDELLIRAINLVKNLQSRIAIAKEMPEEEAKKETIISTEDEKMIKTAEQYIESRISESALSVSEVASSVAMSERQFYRKIGKLTGMTPAHFIMEIRLHYAHQLLLSGKMIKLSQVAYEIGINSPSYFSKLFYERFGKKASKYLNK